MYQLNLYNTKLVNVLSDSTVIIVGGGHNAQINENTEEPAHYLLNYTRRDSTFKIRPGAASCRPGRVKTGPLTISRNVWLAWSARATLACDDTVGLQTGPSYSHRSTTTFIRQSFPWNWQFKYFKKPRRCISYHLEPQYCLQCRGFV